MGLMQLPNKMPLLGEDEQLSQQVSLMRNHSKQKSDTLPGYVLNESSQWDITLSYKSVQGKPDSSSGKHICLHLFLNSVHNTQTFIMK